MSSLRVMSGFVISSHVMSFRGMPSRAVSCHLSLFMSCHAISCPVISSPGLSCTIISCLVTSSLMSCHAMLCHLFLCHVLPCHVLSCYVMSCHVLHGTGPLMSFFWCHVSCIRSRRLFLIPLWPVLSSILYAASLVPVMLCLVISSPVTSCRVMQRLAVPGPFKSLSAIYYVLLP